MPADTDIMQWRIAFDLLANRYVELAAAFARRDREGAATFTDELTNRVAVLLTGLRAEMERNGQGAMVRTALVPAAEMLRQVLREAQKAAQAPQH